jgi:predicted SprT family Zn-dependent metalloprotease
VTATEYRTLQDAYDYFDGALFDGCLPQVLITLQRHPRALGYFSAKRFQGRGDRSQRIHEIALNPNGFTGNTDEEILSTLVHEMVHAWQKEYGRSGRGRYHNRQWAAKMYSVGLVPSATGKPGGAVTGDRVSHYILENGRFQLACREFLQRYKLTWEAAIAVAEQPDNDGNDEMPQIQTRAKFTCPNCGLNAWAKPSAQLDCHDCTQEGHEPVLMQPDYASRTAATFPAEQTDFPKLVEHPRGQDEAPLGGK